MTMIARLKQAIRKQGFQPPRWAIIINPFFIVRRALYMKVKAVSPDFKGHILDFGCGSKPFSNLFTGAETYIGVDVEVSGHDHKDSVIDVLYDGRILPFPDQRFDNVVAFEVFEHIFNLEEILIEIRRVTKPGGCLLFSVPFGWDEHERPFDFARYTTFGLKHIIERTGYETVSIERTNSFVAAVGQLVVLYVYFITRSRYEAINKAVQLLVVFPMMAVAVVLGRVLPKIDTFFSGIVVIARVPYLESEALAEDGSTLEPVNDAGHREL